MFEHNFIVEYAKSPKAVVFLAHGAGAGMHSEFMADMANRLSHKGMSVVRFNFEYMDKIASEGRKRPPDRAAKLLDKYAAVVEHVLNQENDLQNLPVVIGGKSMGGRMATLIASESRLAQLTGVIVFGYPFHPPGKPEKLRVEHLKALTTPLLILQGERDTFGKIEEVKGYALSEKVTLHFLTDGDHSLKPRKASGISYIDNLELAASYCDEFVTALLD